MQKWFPSLIYQTEYIIERNEKTGKENAYKQWFNKWNYTLKISRWGNHH